MTPVLATGRGFCFARAVCYGVTSFCHLLILAAWQATIFGKNRAIAGAGLGVDRACGHADGHCGKGRDHGTAGQGHFPTG